jgi:organic hydroperoxide reductase OsmC/OhrA
MHPDHHYRALVTWSGAVHGPTSTYQGYSREFRVEIEGKPALIGSADPAFRGDPALPNPEDQLLTALAACHMLSWLALCAMNRIAVTAYRDQATATMAWDVDTYRFTEVVLHPQATLAAVGDLAKATALHEQAHHLCFIARSVNFPVRTMPTFAT